MKKPNVTFRRRERDCGKNKDLRERGEALGIIYDYDVMVGDEIVACFQRYGVNGGGSYELVDRLGRPLVRPDRLTRLHIGEECRSKDEFFGVLKTVHIPTAEECAAYEKQEQRARVLEARQQEREARKHRVMAAGPKLLAMLKQCLYDPAKVTKRRHREIVALITKLEA